MRRLWQLTQTTSHSRSSLRSIVTDAPPHESLVMSSPLGADVVELENHGIPNPAISARVTPQMVIDHRSSGDDPLALRSLGLVAVQLAALFEVIAKALSTPSLSPVAEAVESDLRKDPHAPWADLEFAAVNGLNGGRLRGYGCRRSLNTAHPQACGRKAHAELIGDLS